MPVSYCIDHGNGLIRTKCTGKVTFADVVDHFRALEQDPNCPERLDVLLDLTELTSLPSSEQIQAISGVIGRIEETVRFDGCAIAASSDVIFGISRMFEVLTRKRFRATCVVRTVGEAEAWLIAQRAAPAKSASSGESSH